MMCSNAIYQACQQTDTYDDNRPTITENEGKGQNQNLISPSSTIPEQLECHVPALPTISIYHTCATRSRIALALICTLLLTFVIFAITAAKSKTGFKFGANTLGLETTFSQQWMSDQMALGLSQQSVVVDTKCGKLIGDEEHESYVFKGIPYAVPPTGARRWSPPLPIANDSSNCNQSGQRHAIKFGSPCAQVNPYTKQVEGKEDCLYLNIWTPNIDSGAKLQVMVWIHGGFLQFGSGHQPGLRPNGKLAKSQNTVYVSLNFRLYAFGFMPLDVLINNNNNDTKNNSIKIVNKANKDNRYNNNSTNYGLMDIIIALQWIQNNIHIFGGDPHKVTLFGADSGAALILAITSNPDMRHLYSSSWLINPALYLNHSFADASKHNRKNFLKYSGCDSRQCLLGLTSNQVIEHFLGKNDPSFRINDQNDLPILGIMSEQLITIDDIYVRDAYPFSESMFNSPVLIGSTSQAIEFWPGPRDLDTWQWRDYTKYVTTSLDSFGAQVSRQSLQLYAPVDDGNQTTPAIQYINMVSDLRQVCPIDYLAQTLAQNYDNNNNTNNSSVYRYIFSARLSDAVRVYGYPSSYSFHLIEVIAYFDEIESFIRHPTKDDFAIRDTIQQLVQSFVNNLNINQNFYHSPNKNDYNNNNENKYNESSTTSSSATTTQMSATNNVTAAETSTVIIKNTIKDMTNSTIVTINSTTTEKMMTNEESEDISETTTTTTTTTTTQQRQPNNEDKPRVSLGQPFPQQFIEITSRLTTNMTSIYIKNYIQSDRCLFWQMNRLFDYVWTV
ncbi:acetylcholinesterase-like [Oppia nitens]|uniref:acetylcholinesterase-like n=1 Tax=Oppia nitens TaxID=1686743 RepID=UPI0023DA9025|nr:acetylcholinesterase-like [Oppia nitens]